jgi:hypothetical protein
MPTIDYDLVLLIQPWPMLILGISIGVKAKKIFLLLQGKLTPTFFQ